MQKLVLVLLFGSIAVGALMPSQQLTSEPPRSVSARPERALTVAASPQNEEQTRVEISSGTVTLDRSSDGHFYAQAQVNGMPVKFLVDTGATNIALSREDAQRAFIATDPEMDEVIGSGASGAVKGQIVKLDRVTLGPAEVLDIDAAVLAGGKQSLLGQSFLAQFESVTIEGNKMVLR
jgi:aspartyl protease family protein